MFVIISLPEPSELSQCLTNKSEKIRTGSSIHFEVLISKLDQNCDQGNFFKKNVGPNVWTCLWYGLCMFINICMGQKKYGTNILEKHPEKEFTPDTCKLFYTRKNRIFSHSKFIANLGLHTKIGTRKNQFFYMRMRPQTLFHEKNLKKIYTILRSRFWI